MSLVTRDEIAPTCFLSKKVSCKNSIARYTAARKSDEGQICTHLLASSLIDSLRSASGLTCDKAVNNALDDADSYDLTVKSVNVSGNTATAVVDSKNKATNDTLKLVKEGGRWKIASL